MVEQIYVLIVCLHAMLKVSEGLHDLKEQIKEV